MTGFQLWKNISAVIQIISGVDKSCLICIPLFLLASLCRHWMRQKHLTYWCLHLPLHFKPWIQTSHDLQDISKGGAIRVSTATWPHSSFLFSAPSPVPLDCQYRLWCSKIQARGYRGNRGESLHKRTWVKIRSWGRSGTNSRVKWGLNWLSGQRTLESNRRATRIAKLKQKPHIRKWESRWDKGKNRVGGGTPLGWANLMAVGVCDDQTQPWFYREPPKHNQPSPQNTTSLLPRTSLRSSWPIAWLAPSATLLRNSRALVNLVPKVLNLISQCVMSIQPFWCLWTCTVLSISTILVQLFHGSYQDSAFYLLFISILLVFPS